MKHLFQLFIFLFILQSTVYSQEPNYKVQCDINRDGTTEEIMFYDLSEEEFEKTQFTKITIIKGTDSISFVNDDVWVTKPDLYQKSDKQIANHLGIFFENKRVFLWLTGFQYGCCLNTTSILEYTGDSIKEVFNREFEVEDIRVINGKRYVIGRQWLSEDYGGFGIEEAPYYFMSIAPKEYRTLNEKMNVDSAMTQKANLIVPMVEEHIDIYNATLVHINRFNKDLLISKELESSLYNREYGIVSLVKLNNDYLENYSKNELRIIRNEIFAYKGYKFNSKDLKEYYAKNNWYKPFTNNSDSIFRTLSDIEKYNIELIRKIEKTVGNKPQ
ncbi:MULTISPECIES: YARHG domain-containing protein [unclassified Carboxylicivirga]|uniref:YARHG domain-containing protein n=1 Tax=Carboxylicivirga TaxID=1628153 RepID=UPI003D336E8C